MKEFESLPPGVLRIVFSELALHPFCQLPGSVTPDSAPLFVPDPQFIGELFKEIGRSRNLAELIGQSKR